MLLVSEISSALTNGKVIFSMESVCFDSKLLTTTAILLIITLTKSYGLPLVYTYIGAINFKISYHRVNAVPFYISKYRTISLKKLFF